MQTSGNVWKHQRRFAASVLRTSAAENCKQIASEASYLCDEISKFSGNPFDPRPLLTSAVANIICTIVFGKRFDYDDKDIQRLLSIYDERTKLLASGITVDPLLRLIRRKEAKALIDSFKETDQYVSKLVAQHKKTVDDGEVKGLVDLYLQEIEQTKNDPNMSSVINEDNLIAFADNLFIAGTETSSNTLSWCILYMIARPELQKRIRSEVDAVCGRDRLPSYSDRESMPFTVAVILEVQRLHTLIPLGKGL